MPGALPFVEGAVGGSDAGAFAGAQAAGVQAGAAVTYDRPTHLYVAGLILLALGGLVLLHVTGFRFATDVGVTRG